MSVLSLGADLKLPDGVSVTGRVHASFERAVHIEVIGGSGNWGNPNGGNPNPILVTLLCGMDQQGMRLINIAKPSWPTLHKHLQPGETIQLTRYGLQHVNFRFSLDKAPVWKSPVLAVKIEAELLKRAHQWLQAYFAWEETQNKISTLWRTAYERFNELLLVLVSEPLCMTELDHAVRATIGLGPGLTPSGDDMISGLLVGLRTGEQADKPSIEKRLNALSTIVHAHLPSTSLASRDALEQASRGWITARLADVLAALTGKPGASDLKQALVAQSTLGQHSGIDSLYGFFAGISIARRDFSMTPNPQPLQTSPLFSTPFLNSLEHPPAMLQERISP